MDAEEWVNAVRSIGKRFDADKTFRKEMIDKIDILIRDGQLFDARMLLNACAGVGLMCPAENQNAPD